VRLTLPVFNDRALTALLELLAPHLRPEDTLMLVSGNADKPLSLPWLSESLQALQALPPRRLLAATAGHAHLAALAGAGLEVAGLVYIYEPGFANVPEFSWGAPQTLWALEEAVAIAHEHGYPLVFKPTGRPLLQGDLKRYGWHYGRFAERCEALFVQTQTYCRAGTFGEALAKLASECAAHLDRTYVQVTADPAAPNGVPSARALACLRAARAFAGATLWWSPRAVEAARSCLASLRP
jgi:hypothetical protein